jgi:ubiquitin-protein ligase
LGVFEVIGKKDRYKRSGTIYVCPDETQLIQRYLLIVPGTGYSNSIRELNNIFNSEIYTQTSKIKTRILSKGIKKLVREYKKIKKMKEEEAGFRVEMTPDNTYLWKVYIFGYDPKSTIGKDMKKLKIKEIEMEVRFPENYPLSPPFIRVISPRFKYQTGHVTSAGALCMQVLTDKFWSPACSIESLIITIKSEILEGEGQLDYQKWNIPYTLNEAKSSFIRVARGHGWQ